jgi:hypothetical protein
MKHIVTLLLWFTFLPAFCQIRFEKGYFIDNSGKRTECLIENKDWLNNPEEFRYKLNENDNPSKAIITEVAEFGIDNFSKYVRADVQIDSSLSNLNEISIHREPEWLQKMVFLKVVVEGKADLYIYENQRITRRFFYTSPNDSTIRQLVYKKYVPDNVTLKENALFRQQLFTDVKCGNNSRAYFERISYKIDELKKHFIAHNKCMGDIVNEPAKLVSRDLLNLKVTSGIHYTSFAVTNSSDKYLDMKFTSKLSFRAGLEIEYIFPFNKNKWSLLIEPTYQYFKSEGDNGLTKASINYERIEVPISIRHYFFLSNTSKLFLNASLLPFFGIKVSDYSLKYKYSNYEADINPTFTWAVGGGWQTGKFSVEARYYGNQNILAYYLYYGSSYQKTALIIGYRFLQARSRAN